MQHVIVGGGPAATNAVETIRAFDQGASRITLVSDEAAHSRMALPYWLSGRVPKQHVYTADAAWLRDLDVQARLGVRARSVDPHKQQLELEGGDSLHFDHLLIATGASPRPLAVPGADLPGVQTLWTLSDTEALIDRAGGKAAPRVVMIGAGFIGFIMLAAMARRGWQLAVVEREPHVLPRMLNEPAAALVEAWLRSRGIALYCGMTVNAIRPVGASGRSVELADGTTLESDAVIVATGIRPNLELVAGSGIATDQGILVNDRMQTNFPSIYAAGDVAQGPVLIGKGPAIHAIQPTAVDHGRIAGANMAGQQTHYEGSLLMNILDACGLQCASLGQWQDPQAETTTISNASGPIYRQLLFSGDQISGAIFVGQANDLGMLTDLGMVKGIMQTRTQLGQWKDYLAENPFDVRKAFVACNVAGKLTQSTLLGRASLARRYRFQNPPATVPPSKAHQAYVRSQDH